METGSEPKAAGGESATCVRVLCGGKIAAFCRDAGIYWLIGSPRFLSPFTVVSVLRCLHSAPGEPHSPHYVEEADDIKMLLSRGFAVVGALYVSDEDWEGNAKKAVEATMQLNKLLSSDDVVYDLVGAAADLSTAEIHFFASEHRKSSTLEPIRTVIYEDKPEQLVWENSCLLRCQLEFKLPIYVPLNKLSEKIVSSATNAIAAKLRDSQVVYIIEGNATTQQPVVFRGVDLSANIDASGNKHYDTKLDSGKEILKCSQFLLDAKKALLPSRESAEIIQVTVFHNTTEGNAALVAPVAEFLPATESSRLLAVNFKLDVLCYAARDFSLSSAILQLVIPGLVDQLDSLSKAIYPNILSQEQEPQLCPYHFFPPGILHPLTAIYDLAYGETEIIQAKIRKSLHVRMGLPLDRPLLLKSNSLFFGSENNSGKSSSKSGSVIKDVHLDIPKSGVYGGLTSLIEGSYEYYHYLQDGFDDSGWGCAYRSLQTILSWFRLQHYTTTIVPSHKEIQKALVEIGDKESSFVGSREWIGAIELSFVLDKLLGVSCKIINVRSGAELPEKCRELALHFETQGTPVMIGGGVLAYTLLGVDYNDASGDCAFLILDPHYTGSDDLKKIVNGGWCGWKKAVDSKGKNFFLHDKFYNLLLPQRPNMV